MVSAARTLIPILGWLIAFGLPLLVVCWSTRWIPKRWARIYARVVILPPVWFVVFTPLLSFVTRPLSEGDWRCVLCGAIEHRVEYRPCVLQRSPVTRPLPEELDSRAFQAWYEREIGSTHAHDWMPIGCHFGSGWVACSGSPGWPYYRVLPSLPDPAIAKALVARLQKASHEARFEMIRDFEWSNPDDPFQATLDGRVLSSAEFDVAYTHWLSVHPAWQ